MMLKSFFLYKVIWFFFINLRFSYAFWEDSQYSRRVAVPIGSPTFIYLNDIGLEIVLIRNVGINDVNYCIKHTADSAPIYVGVAKNNTIAKIDTNYFLGEIMPKASVLRFDNYKEETAIVYVTTWHQKYEDETPEGGLTFEPPKLRKKKKKPVYYRKYDMCETPIIDPFVPTFYEEYTNELGVRDYSIMTVNMIPFIGPVIDPILETFWLNKVPKRDTGSLFQTIIYDLNNYFDKKTIDNLQIVYNQQLEEIKQKLTLLQIVLNENGAMAVKKLNKTEQMKLQNKRRNTVDQYKNLVYLLSGKEMFFMPKNQKKQHYFLELICSFINLQVKIYNIGLMQIGMTEEVMNNLRHEKNIELPYLSTEQDTMFLEDIKSFLKTSIENYNSYVQNLIDNLYVYAYEDSLTDQNVYNAVAKAHNHILQYGVAPIRFLVEKYLLQKNINVDFTLADFKRPSLYFSQLIGSATLESAIRAQSIINDLYDLPTHNILRSVSRMVVQLNRNNDIVGIVNYDDREKRSAIDVKLAVMDLPRHEGSKKIEVNIPLSQYIAKAEICFERANEFLTKLSALRIQKSNGHWIDLGGSRDKNNSICHTHEIKNHSIYRLTIFSDICRNDGAGVNVALVYKQLEESNELMVS